jgi:hypothetical protein
MLEAHFLNYYLLLSLERRCEMKLLKLACRFIDFKKFKISGQNCPGIKILIKFCNLILSKRNPLEWEF